MAAQRGEADPFDGSWSAFIDECNRRNLFNARVAEILNLPYAANSTRLPIRYEQLKNATAAHRYFLDVDEIQSFVSQRAEQYLAPYVVELPVFLTVALERASRPENLWEVTRPCATKQRLIGLTAVSFSTRWPIAIKTRSPGCVVPFWLTPEPCAAFGPKTVLTVVSAILSTGVGLAAWIATSLTLVKATSDVASDAKAAVLQRITRRDEWFVTRLGESASHLTNGLNKVEKLWQPDAGVIQGCADRLSQGCADRLSQVQQLDTVWPVPS